MTKRPPKPAPAGHKHGPPVPDPEPPLPPARTSVSTTSRNQVVTISSGTGDGGPPRQTWGDRVWAKFNTILLVCLLTWFTALIVHISIDPKWLSDWLAFIAGNFMGALLRDMFGDRSGMGGDRHADFRFPGHRAANDTCCCRCHGETTASQACSCPCHPDHKAEEPGIQA